MYIYLNGQMVKQEEALISPFDHGFLYGMGLFETFRIYDGHPFLLKDHLERLRHGLETMNIRSQFSDEGVQTVLEELLEKNQISNAYIRMNVSAGAGEIGLRAAPYSEPNMIIFAKELPEQAVTHEKEIVVLNLRRNTPEGEIRLKSHHYMNNLLAKQELGDDSKKEGLFLTEGGFAAEGIASNIFWIKGETLYSPSVDLGILNGITRLFVMRLAEKNGLSVEEGHYLPSALTEADEIFVTNSIQEIVPVSAFENGVMPGMDGKYTMLLSYQYKSLTSQLLSRHEL
ncbi:aminodeoxychorismate lyase [Cytobacillus gottheilii]|uniref:aminodeoxychorismate lyase n=1 Tax=Cytobacillus gottheilii TaxID=859144 RepID=UPI00082FE0B6|nr:aminodeoxychorismate lyase [Cytobacillus gottheilii]